MQKIMFNDKYGLTQAVLEGHKTMTRRIIGSCYNEILDMTRYAKGEVAAIAQSYNSVIQETFDRGGEFKGSCSIFRGKGLNNKMFVRADLMPHHIKIAYIKVERLQDISEEDCLKEGIKRCNLNKKFAFDDKRAYNTAREAFAALIDKVSGKGTWNSNPWCFCYEFKLID